MDWSPELFEEEYHGLWFELQTTHIEKVESFNEEDRFQVAETQDEVMRLLLLGEEKDSQASPDKLNETSILFGELDQFVGNENGNFEDKFGCLEETRIPYSSVNDNYQMNESPAKFDGLFSNVEPISLAEIVDEESLENLKLIPDKSGKSHLKEASVEFNGDKDSEEINTPKDCLEEELVQQTISHKDIIHHNKQIIASFMKLVCDLCSMEFDSFAKLRPHFLEAHNIKVAYVKCCNTKYSSPSKLVDHIKWHQNKDSFKCKFCNKQLKNQDCLEAHLIAKHKGDNQVNEKVSDHHYFKCPYCPRTLKSEHFLKKHIERHQTGHFQDFICKHCGKRFINMQRLKSHIEAIHKNVYPYQCDICGKYFKTERPFIKHKYAHQGITEKPKKCETCHKWLKNERSYRSHLLIHQKKTTPCSYCGQSYSTKIALISHINYMHKRKALLQCHHCEKTFKTPKNLNEHLAVHMKTMLYKCDSCGKEFRSKAKMYVHIKEHHVLDWLNAKATRSNDPHLTRDY